ncbi:EAL domain-containing protein, partial [Arthrospira platensis SPKY1]|nr:EAL domain-containing protein [Arthrospira platensis SPKY1]
PTLQERVTQRAALQREMKQGLRDGELLLFGQPIVDGQCRTQGVEGLVRWQHPVRGLVPPAQFIPLAEESGFILNIGQWVLQQACAYLAAWQHDPVRARWTLAINLSAKQLRQPDFVDHVRSALAQSG